MKVDRLVAEGFRNIGKIELNPHQHANIIYGDNAQGKTNLLEAIWLFCGARSFRGAKDREFIGFKQELARLQLTFTAQEREQTAELVFGKTDKRILYNEIPQDRRSALVGQFCAVVFSPDQLSMVKQGPEGRRRFLDTSLGQILPKYAGILDGYDRILRQRAHLLRDSARQPGLLDTLDVWDNPLVEYGAYIMATRAKYIARLEEAAAKIYDGISSGKESLSLSYKSSCSSRAIPADKGACKELMAFAVKESFGEDMRLGATTVGPHRDDLTIGVGGLSARSFGSQGQQRSCVLALKLAECELMANSIGEQPVVLLDDVMSELDDGRRRYLLNHLTGRQVFITCCDAGSFKELQEGKIVHIRGGAVEEE